MENLEEPSALKPPVTTRVTQLRLTMCLSWRSPWTSMVILCFTPPHTPHPEPTANSCEIYLVSQWSLSSLFTVFLNWNSPICCYFHSTWTCCVCSVHSVPLNSCYPVDGSPQASLSMGFSSQEYWSGLPFPHPGNLPNPGTEPMSPALAGTFFTTEHLGNP